MDHDFQYECALAAALVIRELYDGSPGSPKHELLAKTIFAILHAMDRFEEGREVRRVRFSDN